MTPLNKLYFSYLLLRFFFLTYAIFFNEVEVPYFIRT